MNTLTTPKLRPMLFSGPMIQALLDGKKTQTRRIVKLPSWSTKDWNDFTAIDDYVSIICEDTGCEAEMDCPYGQPGDVIWVRETFAKIPRSAYWHDQSIPHAEIDDEWYIYRQGWDRSQSGLSWKPSIHMPYAACRLWLEILSVRVERLQDISEDDAIAEGIASTTIVTHPGNEPGVRYQNYLKRYDIDHPMHQWAMTAKHSYETLWEKINGRDSWRQNPFVWVVEFERTEKP